MKKCWDRSLNARIMECRASKGNVSIAQNLEVIVALQIEKLCWAKELLGHSRNSGEPWSKLIVKSRKTQLLNLE